jgi:phospholipid/cholesterol/gamma-HCH transport system substrate-binding protein
VSNVNHLTLELRPIVDDVRVFTDKIARHPEQLGVRGALDRRPAGIK